MKLARVILSCVALSVLVMYGADDVWIDWYTMDAGGGTTANEEFSLSGTVGQPDAGMLIPNCCGFSILGGYWSQFSDVDQPNGPRLCIKLTRTNTFLLTWRIYHAGYVLQKRTVNAVNWTDLSSIVPVLGPTDYEASVDDLAGWVATICTNLPSGTLTTNIGPYMTGFGWYLYSTTLGPNPPPDCQYPVFCATNEPTFFRLRRY